MCGMEFEGTYDMRSHDPDAPLIVVDGTGGPGVTWPADKGVCD